MTCWDMYIWKDNWLNNKKSQLIEDQEEYLRKDKEELDLFIKKNSIKEIILYNFRWWNSYTLKTSDNYEILYYKWKTSNKYKEIIDYREYYNMDNVVWEDWNLKKSMINRISKNKEHVFIYAKKLNWNYVIAKDFKEWVEFSKLNEFIFDNNNENIIYSVDNSFWEENIYINDKFIYKRQYKWLNDEIVFTDNWKYIIWDRDKDWNVILYYNWELIKTNYKDIEKLSLSVDGTSYWFLWSIDIPSKYLDNEFPYIYKDWKEIINLLDKVRWKYNLSKISFANDTNKLIFFLRDSYNDEYSDELKYKNYILIDDKIINIPNSEIYFTDYNFYYNTESYYYNDNIFALKVVRNKKQDNWLNSAILYYNSYNNEFKLSNYYKDIYSVKFSDFWRNISFIWLRNNDSGSNSTVFVNNFDEYEWFLQKYGHQVKDIFNSSSLYTLNYLELTEWWVTWFYNNIISKWCFYDITWNNKEEIILNKLDYIYFKLLFKYNSNYVKLEKFYSKILKSLNSIESEVSTEKINIFKVIKNDIENSLDLIRKKIVNPNN